MMPTGQMLYGIATVWTSLEEAKAELKAIATAFNNTDTGILRAEIVNGRCSVESCENGQWRLISRYHIEQKILQSKRSKKNAK